jgi:hypothetical protein
LARDAVTMQVEDDEQLDAVPRRWSGTRFERFLCELTDWLGWSFCELAFKTGCIGTGWSYRLGTWLYGLADRWETELTTVSSPSVAER